MKTVLQAGKTEQTRSILDLIKQGRTGSRSKSPNKESPNKSPSKASPPKVEASIVIDMID